MRIIVKDKDSHLNIPIPTRLVFNGLTAGLLCWGLENHGTHMTRKQLMVFVKELHRFRRRHPRWTLVEVEGHEGEHVRIEL